MNMPVYKISAAQRLTSLLKYELNPDFCRESFVLKAGDGAKRTVKLGTPLMIERADGSVTAVTAAEAGNTGNGALTLNATPTTASAKDGIYTVTCTTGGADGTSKFAVEDPGGKRVGTATGGTAFNKHVKFTIAGGGTAFVEGDSFSITVEIDEAADDSLIVAWDGDFDIWGVALGELIADDGVDRHGGIALRRGPAIMARGEISWPDGLTDQQKADGLDRMAGLGVVFR